MCISGSNKHGKSGSTAYTGDGKSYSIRPFPVEALKGFGGGDGYASSFLYGLFQGYEIMDCLELGSASASMLVASHGCSADMPLCFRLFRSSSAGKRNNMAIWLRE